MTKEQKREQGMRLLAASLELMVNRAYDIDATVRHEAATDFFIVNDRNGERLVDIGGLSPLKAAQEFCFRYFSKLK